MLYNGKMDNIVSLCKRRGFIYPSSEIYGGLANTWDFGHYGTLLKQNIRDAWWKTFVLQRDDMTGIDASIFLNPKTWEASGHVAGFTDALIDCRNCRHRMRADHIIEEKFPDVKVEGLSVEKLTEIIREKKLHCKKCGSDNLTDVRTFNLLFQTHIGVVEESQSLAYLRGEIAQGIFLNFKNVIDTMRVRIPFGIAQQGKAFRNEITTGQFVHRTLEFDLMEFEYFVRQEQWEEKFEYWRREMWKWAQSLGIREEKLRWREHEEFERSHYSKRTMDIEYEYPSGWKEMFGIAYRGDFDLQNHALHSGKDLRYTDPASGEKYIPHVIEPTFGLSRLTGIVICDAYREEQVNEKTRTYLQLHPRIAPVKAAVFPLQKDEELHRLARTIYEDIKKRFNAEFDHTGNIGQMYRRQDEIGTPYCVTVDYESLKDGSVTIRDRDTMKQERIPVHRIVELVENKL